MTLNLSVLNNQQNVAVNISEGSVLVIAGAGSGKTKTITYRIANLISKKLAHPSEILAVTFTNKAARELSQRVNVLLSNHNHSHLMQSQVVVSTFHKFGAKLLRRYSAEVGRKEDFTIYDRNDVEVLFKQIVKDENLSTDDYPIQWLISLRSEMKNNSLLLSDLKRSFPNKWKKIENMFEQYELRLRRSNSFDLDDLLFHPVNILKSNPSILHLYQKQIQFIHVDEYQDTNTIQLELLRLLDGGRSIVFAVGDVDQAIYGWRGADIRNILKFKSDFKNAKIVKLEQNYRSTPGVLRSANAVIEKNHLREKKILWTTNSEGEKIRLLQAYDVKGEASNTIEWLLKDTIGTKAVLFRTNAQSLAFEQYCIQNQVPYQLVGTVRFFDRREIKDSMAYIKLIAQPSDDIAFERAIYFPTRGVGKTSMQKVKEFAHNKNISYTETVSSELFLDYFGKKLPTGLLQFIAEIDSLRKDLKEKNCIFQKIDNSFVKMGFFEALKKDLDGIDRIRNVKELLNQFDQYFQKYPDNTITDFIEFVSLQSEQDELDDVNSTNKVLLMTVHASKGLEFDSVAIVGLEETLFPLGDILSSDVDLEEERRLFYVAMTRAKKRLLLSRVNIRERYGRNEQMRPSRFLHDVPKEELEGDVTALKFGIQNQRNLSSIKRTPSKLTEPSRTQKLFYVGQTVNHPHFGVGNIVSCSKIDDGFKIIVDFGSLGSKTILTKYTNLEIRG